VPVSWIGRQPGALGDVTGLLDVRGFYHYTSEARTSWSGVELLSYVDILDGLSGAFILRQEARDEVARYGSFMLVPRLSQDSYLVFGAGLGNAAAFQPVVRLDAQVRWFFPPWPRVMFDVGGFASWWTSQREQIGQSNAVILWLNPIIVELRQTVFFTQPDMPGWRANYKVDAVLLFGADNVGWFMSRASFGTEPESVPGKAFLQTRNLPVGSVTVGYRKWITPHYGVNAEVESYGQLRTWHRLGLLASLFVDF
jgi:hypothetical protein